MIPFARECQTTRSDTVVQEDNAPSHAYWYTSQVYSKAGIEKILQPANSPDLSPIEKAWPYMKRSTTFGGAPTARNQAEKRWLDAWRDLL